MTADQIEAEAKERHLRRQQRITKLEAMCGSPAVAEHAVDATDYMMTEWDESDLRATHPCCWSDCPNEVPIGEHYCPTCRERIWKDAEGPIRRVKKRQEWVTAVILFLALLAVIVAVVVPLRRLWP